jgi:AcrR family transcriptional regulator
MTATFEVPEDLCCNRCMEETESEMEKLRKLPFSRALPRDFPPELPVLDRAGAAGYNEHCSDWGDFVNTVVTSKEEILKISRQLIRQQGWPAVNIRSVAAACGVSVGSIYNYFGSKAELVGAIVESIWWDIFHHPEGEKAFQDIQRCVLWLYQRMEYGCRKYPDFFTLHSMGFMRVEKEDGKRLMQKTWQHILDSLCDVLRHDKNIRPDAFDEQFTAEKFADVLFSQILSALLRKDYDPSGILEIIRRTLY